VILLQGSDELDVMIRKLKKDFDKSNLRTEIEIRSYPKPSERKKQKALKARLARVGRKKERMPEGRNSINEKSPSWRFVYRDGVYYKVMIPRRETGQI